MKKLQSVQNNQPSDSGIASASDSFGTATNGVAASTSDSNGVTGDNAVKSTEKDDNGINEMEFSNDISVILQETPNDETNMLVVAYGTMN